MRDRARELRRDSTAAEEVLWDCLRGRRFEGLKFRRQAPLGSYVVDFYCETLRLCVEVDGEDHEFPEQVVADQERDLWLRDQGYMVVRFRNSQVFGEVGVVMETLRGLVSGLRGMG